MTAATGVVSVGRTDTRRIDRRRVQTRPARTSAVGPISTNAPACTRRGRPREDVTMQRMIFKVKEGETTMHYHCIPCSSGLRPPVASMEKENRDVSHTSHTLDDPPHCFLAMRQAILRVLAPAVRGSPTYARCRVADGVGIPPVVRVSSSPSCTWRSRQTR